ncbi:MAG TPA: hypothetical protein VI893_09445, partial [Thermoplasmata archaeon]|nr:hypothetical protein [Thermoplasmata archaeon]
ALRHAGYRTTPQAGPESHLLTAASPDGFRVDIWFTPDIAWDKGGYQRKRVTEIRGEKVNFVSPEELIARKLWRYRKEANHQDLEDVRVILAGSAKLDLEFLEVSLGAMRTWGLFQELLSEAEKSKQPGADGNPVTNS